MKFLASVLQIVIASRPLPLVYAASTNDGTRKFDASPTKAIQSTTGKKPTIVNNYSTSQQQLQLQDLNLYWRFNHKPLHCILYYHKKILDLMKQPMRQSIMSKSMVLNKSIPILNVLYMNTS